MMDGNIIYIGENYIAGVSDTFSMTIILKEDDKNDWRTG